MNRLALTRKNNYLLRGFIPLMIGGLDTRLTIGRDYDCKCYSYITSQVGQDVKVR